MSLAPFLLAPAAAQKVGNLSSAASGHSLSFSSAGISNSITDGATEPLRLLPSETAKAFLRITPSSPASLVLADQYQPSISDFPFLPKPATQEVKFENPKFFGRFGTSEFVWQFDVKTSSAFAGSPSKRTVLVELKKDSEVGGNLILEYGVAIRSPNPAKVSFPVFPWIFNWEEDSGPRDLPFNVDNSASDNPATLKIVSGGLRSEDGLTLARDDFVFSKSQGAPFTSEIEVAARSSEIVYLRAAPRGGLLPHGKLVGYLKFSTSGGGFHDFVPTVSIGSRFRRWLGVTLTASGLAFAALISGLIRPKLVRIAAMRPVSVVTTSLVNFRNSLPATDPDPVPLMRARTSALIDSISQPQLDRDSLLPRGFSWVGEVETTFNGALLAVRLESVTTQLGGLNILAETVARLGKNPAHIANVDRLASRSLDAVSARLAVQQIAGIPALGGAPQATPTVAQIDYIVRVGASIFWLLWGLTSLGVCSAWIFGQVGFGTLSQLMGCFLWGFGLTTLGFKLDALTPTTIASPLRVKIP